LCFVTSICYTVKMTTQAEVHFEGKIAQKAIIVKDKKVLLIRDPRMQEVIWEIPGGRMNIDEEPRAAVAREIMEELGVVVTVREVVYMEQFFQSNEGKRAFVIVYEAFLVDENADFVLSADEVSEIAWVSKEEIGNYPLFPDYARALNCYFEKYAN
jgi:ADP-ribose pyrophosphatase YjhB (NUDIX family)